MVFVFAHFIHETVKQLHKLAVFALVVRHAQRRLDLRPGFKRFFNLCSGHNQLAFHLPASYSACVNTARIYTLRRL